SEITVEVGRGHEHVACAVEHRQHRTARRTKPALALGRRTKARDRIAAAQQAKAILGDADVSPESGAVRLAAHRTMTVRHQLERRLRLPRDRAAQAAAFDDLAHDRTLDHAGASAKGRKIPPSDRAGSRTRRANDRASLSRMAGEPARREATY